MRVWEAEERDKSRRQARALERQRRIAEEEASLEDERINILSEKAAEAKRQQNKRAEAEEAHLAKQARAQEQARIRAD
jgi:hypothetical protein